MNREEIIKRVTDQEDNFIERKPEGANSAEIRKTLVAFANSVPEEREAILYMGVADNGILLGVQDTDVLQKRIRRIIDECYPKIDYTSEVFEEKGNKIVAVVVKSSIQRPHFAGPAYVRKGSESVKASEEVYEDLIASRNDKARAILRHKGELITVIARQPLGTAKRIPPKYAPYYTPTEHMCEIESCNNEVVHLLEHRTVTHHALSLKRVIIGYDTKKHRMQIEYE